MDNNGALANTIQSQIHREEYSQLDILPLFVKAGELLPAWWSRSRDVELSRFWPKVDHVASAFAMFASKTASIPIRIIPRDMSIKAHVKQADYFTSIFLDGSDWGQGWYNSLGFKSIIDFISQDNGMFIEVIGDAPMRTDRLTGQRIRDVSRPMEGPALGFAHLDAQRCQRTSNPEYPVIYQDIDGNRYKLHRTRVMYASSMPSGLARMNGVGFSALSRMVNTAQHLLDISTMEQEELGSRPKRRMVIAKKGITAGEIQSAFEQADLLMDNQGLRRYAKNVVIGLSNRPTDANAIEIEVLDLHAALVGTDKEMSITLGMFLIALALNIPPRWLWPASSTGATKADAMYQHIAGMGGGIGMLIQVFKAMLGGNSMATALGKPIPSHLDIIFDYQDDEQDRQAAEIRELRSKVYANNLTSEVMDMRTTRLQALDVGDITEQQFEDMELESGRLPDGTDILNLFYTTDEEIIPMLALSVGDVLNIEENDRETVIPAIDDKLLEVRAILQNPPRPKVFDKARFAFAALQALRAAYEEPNREEMAEQEEMMQEQMMAEGKPKLGPDGKPMMGKPKPEEDEADEGGQKKEKLGLIETIQLLALTRKEKPPEVNITMPEIKVTSPDINISVPERSITFSPPQVENKVFMPQQAAPVVKANINIPQQQKEAPPVINFSPQVNVPETVVNVEPQITVTMPEIEQEVTTVERDENGLIKLAKKFRIYRR